MAGESVPSHEKESQDLLRRCESAGLGFFVKAVRAAGLETLLSEDGPFTLLAPADEAFFSLPRGVMKRLLHVPEYLNNVLRNHVLPAKLMSEELCVLQQVRSITGRLIPVNNYRGVLRLDGALLRDMNMYSLQFIKKVLKQRNVLSIQKLSDKYDISTRTIQNWIQGKLPKGTRNKPNIKLSIAALIEDVKQYPDSYQYERAERLGVSEACVWSNLKKLNISYKKHYGTREQTKRSEAYSRKK